MEYESQTSNVEANLSKAKLLSLAIESLEREFHDYLNEEGISIDEIKKHLENKDNFSEPIWEKLQKEKQKLDLKLDHTEQEGKNPKQLKKTFATLSGIQSHWLFVR